MELPWHEQPCDQITWWRHQMETFSALLAICAGNSPVTGEFPAQRPATRSFDVFFDLRLNKRLSKLSWGWCFETTSRSLWRICNDKLWIMICEMDYHVICFHIPAQSRSILVILLLINSIQLIWLICPVTWNDMFYQDLFLNFSIKGEINRLLFCVRIALKYQNWFWYIENDNSY